MSTQRVSGHVNLVRRQRGGVYYAKYRLADGRQVQKKLGPAWTGRGRPPAGYYTDKTAKEALQAILADARRGTLAETARPIGRTFGDACAEWLRCGEHENDLSLSTLRDYRNVVRVHLLPTFGADTPLHKITTDTINKYREQLLTDGRLARRSIQKMLVIMHGILGQAKTQKWIASNPAADVKHVQVQRSGEFNVLSPVEVEAVARAARNPQDAALFTVAAYTGLRLGELRALRWGDIDFADGRILVRRNLPSHGIERTPKSGKVRSVPLVDRAARALDALSQREYLTGREDRVFVSPTGGPVDDSATRKAFYAALADAGLGHLREKANPIRFHDLRHSFGTLAVRVWPLPEVQGYMGHADISTTMIYAHHLPRREAAAELGDAIGEAIGQSGVTSGVTGSSVTASRCTGLDGGVEQQVASSRRRREG